MAEVIREVHHDEVPASGGNSGLVVGVIVAILILVALFFFARGGFGTKNSGTSNTPNNSVNGQVNTPNGSGSGTINY